MRDHETRIGRKRLLVGGLLWGAAIALAVFHDGARLWTGPTMILCWFVGGLFLIAAFLVHQGPRRFRRIARGECPECGYALRGLTGERCPECGQRVFEGE